MLQSSPAVIPARQTTVNSYVFKLQNENLTSLSDAIDAIGLRVLGLTRHLPGSVMDALEREIRGIGSTCHCLSLVADEASNHAEEWQMWAEGDKVKDALDVLQSSR